MIDEKKLIEDIKKLYIDKTSLREISSTRGILIEAIISLINDQPKIGNWILCNERLPNEEECYENNDTFLVSNGTASYIRLFDFKNKVFCDAHIGCEYLTIVDNNIVKWQLLPKS